MGACLTRFAFGFRVLCLSVLFRIRRAKNASVLLRRLTTAAHRASYSVRSTITPLHLLVLSTLAVCSRVKKNSVRRFESRVVRGNSKVARRARELRPARSRQDRRRQQTRQGARFVFPSELNVNVNTLLKEYSRQVPTEEGAAFAQRTGCLFVEASAKTAVGVTEAFSDVVERIIDTPELWGEVKDKPKASSSASASAAKARAAVGYRTPDSMPGNIDLSQMDEEEEAGGCLC